MSTDCRYVAEWCRQRAAEADHDAAECERFNPTEASFERGRAAGLRKAGEHIAMGATPSDLRFMSQCERRRAGAGHNFLAGAAVGFYNAASVLENTEAAEAYYARR